MGLSGLNSQRKKYHFIPAATCDACHAKFETPLHYVLHCPAYVAQRHQMLQELAGCAPDVIQPLLNFQNNKKISKMLVEIIDSGTGNIQNDYIIFQKVHTYIEETNCFN
jgi:protein involved in ribonucleotide reduction